MIELASPASTFPPPAAEPFRWALTRKVRTWRSSNIIEMRYGISEENSSWTLVGQVAKLRVMERHQ
jgi:hypothetical protein